jgi:hypothetical protein
VRQSGLIKASSGYMTSELEILITATDYTTDYFSDQIKQQLPLPDCVSNALFATNRHITQLAKSDAGRVRSQ